MIRGALPIVQRDLLVLRRSALSEVVTVLAFPLTFFLAFGLGLRGYIGEVDGFSYATFVIPGLVTMTAVLAAFDDSAWGLWFHRRVQLTINEYRVNPITVYDIIIGKLVSGFIMASLKGLAVGIIMAVFTGFRVAPLNALLYLLFIFLGSVLFSSCGCICGTLLDKPESLGRVQGVVIIPAIFLGAVFFPLSSYPAWVQPIVRFVPTTALFEGSRQVALWGRLDAAALLALALSALAAFALAVYIFDRRIEN